jgi:hypothetical protein
MAAVVLAGRFSIWLIVANFNIFNQQRFRLDVQFSALVHNFNNIFSNGHLYRAGRSMNSLPSQILNVGGKLIATHQTISGFSRIHFNKVKKINFSKLL